jgi:hypothetical protein
MQIGYLDEQYHYSFDYQWFLRITTHTDKCFHISKIWGALRFHEDTKGHNSEQSFLDEQDHILLGKAMPTWKKRFYRLKRYGHLLLSGHVAYLARGILRRTVPRTSGYYQGINKDR